MAAHQQLGRRRPKVCASGGDTAGASSGQVVTYTGRTARLSREADASVHEVIPAPPPEWNLALRHSP